MDTKARIYLRGGTRLVWVVWPARTQVDVWRPGIFSKSGGQEDRVGAEE